MSPPTWMSLPNELKFAILDALDLPDAKAFARVERSAYAISRPLLFRNVDLKSLDALLNFVHAVPSSYFHHIRHLRVSTTSSTPPLKPESCHPATDALFHILSGCFNLHQLHLDLASSLAHSIIPVFSRLSNLKRLEIVNLGDDMNSPISERLVVSIAASVPALDHLHLDRISRSHLHAPDLLLAYPPVPIVVSGDESIPDHPLLGSALCLPSLLRLPSLRSLTIHETHLGDPLWSTTKPLCRLTDLDLGSCTHASPSANSISTQTILSSVGHSLQSLTLSATLDDIIPRLEALHTLRLTPFFTPDALPTTAAALSTAPCLSHISVHTFADDFVDICTALTDLLALRVHHGSSAPYLPALTSIQVALAPIPTPDIPPSTHHHHHHHPCTSKPEDIHELASAGRALHDFCHDLALTSVFFDLTGAPLIATSSTALQMTPGSVCLDQYPVLAAPAQDSRPHTCTRVPIPPAVFVRSHDGPAVGCFTPVDR